MDNETYYDKLTKKVKDHPIGAILLLIFVISSSLLTFLREIKETYKDLGFDTQKVENIDSTTSVIEPAIIAIDTTLVIATDTLSTIMDKTFPLADKGTIYKSSRSKSKIKVDTIVNYIVKSNENLTMVADKFNLTLSSLLKINPSLNTNSEITNSEIKIKVQAIHYVGPGDILRVVANKYNINQESIMKANDKSKNITQRGEGLYIPIVNK